LAQRRLPEPVPGSGQAPTQADLARKVDRLSNREIWWLDFRNPSPYRHPERSEGSMYLLVARRCRDPSLRSGWQRFPL